MRLRTLSVLALAGAWLLPAAAGAANLSIGFAQAPRSADPYPFSDATTASFAEHMFETLVGPDDGPLLATEWKWESPTSLVMKLRPKVAFHNGAPFSARDVVYSSCRMAFRPGGKINVLGSAMAPVKNVVAVDDATVRFDFATPNPGWLQKLKFLKMLSASGATLPAGPIAYDGEGKCGIESYPTQADFDSAKAAIGTGPYKLKKFEPTGDAELVRNDAYWGGTPAWENVRIKSVPNSGARLSGLLAGDFDLIESPTSEDLRVIEKDKKLSYTATPSLQTLTIMLLADPKGAPGVIAADGSAPLVNAKVRQALSLAIDRKTIVERLFGGNATVANQFSPRYMPGAPKMPELEYNPQKAQALLKEAGYPNGFEIELSAPTDAYPNSALVSQVITQFWTRIGLKVTLKTMPNSVYQTKRSQREMAAYMFGWGHPQGAAQMISIAFPTPDAKLGLGSSNFTRYSNEGVDRLMREWVVELDDNKRNALVAETMTLLIDDMASIPLYYSHVMWAHRADIAVTGMADAHTVATMAKPKK